MRPCAPRLRIHSSSLETCAHPLLPAAGGIKAGLKTLLFAGVNPATQLRRSGDGCVDYAFGA